MPCLHKFHNELNLEGLNYEPTTLIVGTFNPIWPANNKAEWFYGRTHVKGVQNNNFWDVLPQLYGKPSLINSTSVEWRDFCQEKEIAITDLISCISDANFANPYHQQYIGSYSDDDIAEHFYDFELVNIVRILRKHMTIQQVYITRTVSESFWSNKWFAVERYCEKYGLVCKSILTPSDWAGIQQRKYNKQNPANQLSLPQYIFMRWKNEWHF